MYNTFSSSASRPTAPTWQINLPEFLEPVYEKLTGIPSVLHPHLESIKPLTKSRHATLVIILLVLSGLALVLAELVLYATPHPTPTRLLVAFILNIVFIVVLALFVIEQLLRLYFFGIKYFSNPLNAIDAVLIVATLVLRLLLDNPEKIMVSVLLAGRLWRMSKLLKVDIVGELEDVGPDVEKRMEYIGVMLHVEAQKQAELEAYHNKLMRDEEVQKEDLARVLNLSLRKGSFMTK
jgi:hypothetical protein